MQHTCQDCDHQFFTPGQSDGPSVQPAAQCPECSSYRTQPSGIPSEANDMVHGIGAMPDSEQDDMSGNPLQEGILADNGWQNRGVRDEAFSSVRRARVSLFETPEFETTQIVAPPDLYRHGLETEARHRTAVQIPKGITDNLHAALGNLQAWVENPYENSQLRPYSQYWKVIRPSFMKPGAIQIGVADPTMAEIINHVANTDDPTPLYQYRGKSSSTHTAGPLMALLPEGAAAMLGGGAAAGAGDAAAAAELAGGGEAAASAGASEAGSSASGIGGLMNKVRGVGQVGQGLNYVDDFLGGGAGGPGGGGAGGVAPSVHDMSYYANSDEDDAHPEAHDEIPKQEDGDSKQQDDGNNHEWQRDLSVNGTGGTDHSPSFDPGGPAMQRFMMLAPLLIQMIEGGQSGAGDPLVEGLHQSLESELPGYSDHGDDHAAHQLILMLKPGQGKPDEHGAEPERNAPDHTDENSGGAHESRVASLYGEVSEFLPDLDIVVPDLYRPARTAAPMPMPMGGPPMGGSMPPPPSPMSAPSPMPATPGAPDDSSQGPVTDEQQAWFAKWLDAQGRSDDVPKMLANPQAFAKEFAQARQREVPPQNTEDAGMSSNPPAPAQESAPPGDTMPVPGMQQQMMSAVQRYAADNVAGQCPKCKSHTTKLLKEDGTSICHGCQKIFKTKHVIQNDVTKSSVQSASTWNVDEDLRTEAANHQVTAAGHEFDLGSGHMMDDDTAQSQGVPIADQQHQRDHREEQDSGHTWTDEEGNPLEVGSEYEMYTQKYDIPDLVRIEAVKPTSIIFTIVGEFGLEKNDELTKQEANIEGTTFRSTAQDGELGQGDDSLEQNNDDHTGYSGEPERTDMSAPAGLVAASVIASGVDRENPQLGWLMQGLPRTAGANYTPMEQRALIDESGAARNADMLDLSGTHYITDADDDQFAFGW